MLNRQEDEYLVIAASDLSNTGDEVAGFPLSHIAPEKPLPLTGPVNPAHAATLSALAEEVVKPLLGPREKITESECKLILEKFAPFQAWMAEKAGHKVEKLGENRIHEILQSDMRNRLKELVERDKALENETTSIELVERLVRFYRDIALLCNNFVNFKDFSTDPSVRFSNAELYFSIGGNADCACAWKTRLSTPAWRD